MPTEAPERDTKKYRSELEQPTELTDFSPSRLTLAGKCGLAFQYQYVRKIPAPYDKSYFVFGNAFHNGVEEWYGLPDDGFRTTDLSQLVAAQWPKLVPRNIWLLVERLMELEEECAAVTSAILFGRPDLKSPRTTKAFLQSDASKQFAQARDAMIELCDKHDEIKWSKSEDPWAAYNLSLEMARRAQKRWQLMPRPLAIEMPFSIELFGFRVRGRLDAIRRDPLPSGEFWAGVVDYKTGGRPQTQMEAFLQSYVYTEAVAADPGLASLLGEQLGNVAFYQARKDVYQQGKVDRERHRALASRIFNGRARDILTARFEPSYGSHCEMCDFRALCESEISLWKGSGIVAALMPS